MSDTSKAVILKRRPAGEPVPDDFEIIEQSVPVPANGEILCRTTYLSLDPYMRVRMNEGQGYARWYELGEVLGGGTVAEVLESHAEGFKPGDIVQGGGGWRTHSVLRPVPDPTVFSVRKLDPSVAPVSYALGLLGMPGMTAYVGLLDIGRPTAGETVVVSAAAGAVGSVVGQIARIKGCRAVGIAGSEDKCRYVLDELGFDACINYRSPGMDEALKKACPNGIDVYFDNVGGTVLNTVLRQVNRFARIPLCGVISQYSVPGPVEGIDARDLLFKRVLIRGFIVSDHADRSAAFLSDCTSWFKEGKLKYRETIVDGLENAPAAFIGLLRGQNTGKMLVRVGEDPTLRVSA